MAATLSLIVALILIVIAFAHVHWSLGGTLPVMSEEKLVAMVYGRPGATKMPGQALTAGVGMILFVSALLVLWAGRQIDPTAPDWIALVGTAFFALVFLARGLATFIGKGLWGGEGQMPFMRLDRQIYGPLCIGLSLAMILILLTR